MFAHKTQGNIEVFLTEDELVKDLAEKPLEAPLVDLNTGEAASTLILTVDQTLDRGIKRKEQSGYLEIDGTSKYVSESKMHTLLLSSDIYKWLLRKNFWMGVEPVDYDPRGNLIYFRHTSVIRSHEKSVIEGIECALGEKVIF